MIGYLDKTIRPLILIMPKMGGYIKTFKAKEGDNELTSFRVDDEKLLEKYKAILNKIEDLKIVELNTSPFYDDRYIKTKIRTYDDTFYTNFRGLNVPENDTEYESFTVISIDLFLVYD